MTHDERWPMPDNGTSVPRQRGRLLLRLLELWTGRHYVPVDVLLDAFEPASPAAGRLRAVLAAWRERR